MSCDPDLVQSRSEDVLFLAPADDVPPNRPTISRTGDDFLHHRRDVIRAAFTKVWSTTEEAVDGVLRGTYRIIFGCEASWAFSPALLA